MIADANMEVGVESVVKTQEGDKLYLGLHPLFETPIDLARVLSLWKCTTGKDPRGYFDIGLNWVAPKFWTGVLNCGGFHLQVAPLESRVLSEESMRLFDKTLSRMLCYSSSSTSSSSASVSNEGEMLNSLLSSLCDDFLRLRRRKVLRRYAVKSGSESTPRGRLVFPRHAMESVRNPGAFYSSWVELDEDIPENRIIKHAFSKLKSKCSPHVRRKVDVCLSELDAVNCFRDWSLDHQMIRLDRVSGSYRGLIDRAVSILMGKGVGVLSGEMLATSEIMFTSRVFEEFLSKKFNDLCKGTGIKYLSQGRGDFLMESDNGDSVFELIADGRFVDARGRTVLLVDAKWKTVNLRSPKLGVSSSDVYQALVYGLNYNCNKICLVYPDATQANGAVGLSRSFSVKFHGNLYEVKVETVPMLVEGMEVIDNKLSSLVFTSP